MELFSKIFTLWGLTKLALLFGVISITVFLLLMWWANCAAQSAGEGVLYDDINELPDESNSQHRPDRVALVFGCAEKINGYNNLYFKYRIEAAHDLWKAGKVRGFIVSGDNSRDDYNEPEDMKQSLMKKGVPADKIVCDYAGLRTMDSVVRVEKIFGIKKVILVSQRFHNERAAYIAQKRGIDAIGYNAQDVKGRETQKREYLARVRMWMDENILKTTPKYLGEKETLGF
ncbi:MAG: SanA protein [Cryomorphaceae bacterium]|jgi:SanA protein